MSIARIIWCVSIVAAVIFAFVTADQFAHGAAVLAILGLVRVRAITPNPPLRASARTHARHALAQSRGRRRRMHSLAAGVPVC